jgi:hypothetical protein
VDHPTRPKKAHFVCFSPNFEKAASSEPQDFNDHITFCEISIQFLEDKVVPICILKFFSLNQSDQLLPDRKNLPHFEVSRICNPFSFSDITELKPLFLL